MPDNNPWEAVIARLEEGVENAVRELEQPNSSPRIELWSPPEGMGEIPAELVPRMRRLVAAQKALMERMEERRTELGRQMGAVRKVPTISSSSHSLYLDISG